MYEIECRKSSIKGVGVMLMVTRLWGGYYTLLYVLTRITYIIPIVGRFVLVFLFFFFFQNGRHTLIMAKNRQRDALFFPGLIAIRKGKLPKKY